MNLAKRIAQSLRNCQSNKWKIGDRVLNTLFNSVGEVVAISNTSPLTIDLKYKDGVAWRFADYKVLVKTELPITCLTPGGSDHSTLTDEIDDDFDEDESSELSDEWEIDNGPTTFGEPGFAQLSLGGIEGSNIGADDAFSGSLEDALDYVIDQFKKAHEENPTERECIPLASVSIYSKGTIPASEIERITQSKGLSLEESD